jgi:hypothetical protein
MAMPVVRRTLALERRVIEEDTVPAESLLEVAQGLLVDADAKAAYLADPDGFLAARGLEGLSAEDLADATGHVADTLPAEVAARLGPEGSELATLDGIATLDPVALGPEPEAPDEHGFATGATEAEGGEGAATGAAEEEDEEADDDGEPTMSEQPRHDEPDEDAIAAQDDALAPDPGIGVGYRDDDVDDLAPPEVHDGHLPVGFEAPDADHDGQADHFEGLDL